MSSKRTPRWVTRDECLALHDLMLSDYGGRSGLRDDHLLLSALAKPENLFAYGEPTLAEMAAAYAVGIVKNHPFLDGNKRTGFMLGASFLELNGLTFEAPEEDVVLRTLALASGDMTEAAYSQWFEANTSQRRRRSRP